MIALAPLNVIKNFGRVYPAVEKYRGSTHPEVYHQVFITDNDRLQRWALKDTPFFQLFRTLCQYKLFQHILDGQYTINPVWQSVLSLSDIADMKTQIYVEDTLVLYCTEFESYDTLIPLIIGSYSRLVINGRISWDQAKQFIHEGVKQIRFNTKTFVLDPTDFDDCIDYVAKHSRGYDYK
uniref:Nicotinate phosphoribosyltransferase n=1 Tax=Panagrellus redivivus TaxID=6233 RepID=A0A7E4US31_PANRE